MDYEITTAQVMDTLGASQECVRRARFFMEEATLSLSQTQQRLRDSQQRIDASDELVERMLISRWDDSWAVTDKP